MADATTFAYTARRANGRLVKGRMDAQSEAVVVARMRELSLSPVAITELTKGVGFQREISWAGFKTPSKPKDLAMMTRQLATMITAGIGLLSALGILAEQTENTALRELLTSVRDDVESGQSLSDAVAKHPTQFPAVVISMIRAGESGGFLERSLSATALTLEKQVALRATVKSAMTYPIVVLGMAVAAVAVMLLFVVPVFKTMFEDIGGGLPIPTQILVALSESLIWLAPLLTILTAAGALWWSRNRHRSAVRQIIDPIKLKIPIFGPLVQRIAVAQFCRTFSSMLSAGVPLLSALSIVASTTNNTVVEAAIERTGSAVRLGEPFAQSLATEPVFPPMVTQMLSIGESSGSMEQMLESLAGFMEVEVDAATASLMSMIEPVMVALLGVVIGAMVIALYLPIFEIVTVMQ
ncbi:type IV pilus assembly protein PilC [Plantibacter flavus]|uniref:Type IV pilus assembly protein PilC n=1 Tax=Plantibacter flavus TaxID=150123 RepID=A0A3N2BXP6_9MICO|nr:type II secretion system F family protein [Plantibacter flavus]ROR80007.1 type IV pilus assembly protein PilC [Plantibacter flavus]SMG28460.1 type IV pilus assembly protein PilC [Plantibacter flavus]